MFNQIQKLKTCINLRSFQMQSHNAQVRNFYKTSSTLKNSREKSGNDTISNEPIQFFGSQAAVWRGKDTRSGGSDESLWYQPYVISGSLAVFMLYFFVLREENDIDKKLEGNLFDQVVGLEEMSLAVKYRYNKDHGLDTKELEERLTSLGVNIQELERQHSGTT